MNQILPPAEYLSKIKPFYYLNQEDIAYLVGKMSVSLYKSGKTVFKRGKVLDKIYLVRSGEIGLFHESELVETIGEGEFVGWTSALKREKTEFEGRAISDTICFEFKAGDISKVLPNSQDFSDFVNNLISKRFGELVHSEENGVVKLFSLRISEVISKQPVTCMESDTLIDVVQLMDRHNVGSVIVLNNSKNPVGIITHSDVVRLVAGKMENLSRQAGEVMTSPVQAVDVTSSLFDAYRKFVEYGINHLAVAENGKIVGVITVKNLLKHFEPQMSLLNLPRRIKELEKPGDIETILNEVETTIRRFINLGFSYDRISSIIVPVTDSVVEKILTSRLSGERSTFAVIGSFGRREVEFPVSYELISFNGRNTEISEMLEDFVSVSDLHSFQDDVEGLSRLVDSRYIYGEGKTYIRFREEIEKKMDSRREEIRDFLLEVSPRKLNYENCCEVVEKFARYVSILRGDLLSKSTADRLREAKIPDSKLSESASEAYMAMKFIKLKQKMFDKTERIENLIVKESIIYLRKYIDEVLRVVEDGKRFV
ncbi:CBS domain-containing protein [Geoglobus acetivorans]|uniref:CBS domain-containing protein n=1 Tax=Geoglobus acetivorans TaxID=565033 RepID=A0ABZ3H6G5_GEOAI|nr:CBS domain-containing protein [Geoglobus acetivorans]